jgi:hypothetical protein
LPALHQFVENKDVGDYYIIDFRLNALVRPDVDVEKLARHLEVLQPWEEVMRKRRSTAPLCQEPGPPTTFSAPPGQTTTHGMAGLADP